MFSFIKKSGNNSGGGGGGGGNVVGISADKEEKERKKKEKKERKEKERKEKSSMTSDDLLRLDEVRRSLKLRARRKDKEKEKLPSGITADYSANFFGDLNRDLLPSPNGYTSNTSPLDSPVENHDPSAVKYVNTTGPQSITPNLQSNIQQRTLPLPPLPPRVTRKPTSNTKTTSYRHSVSSESHASGQTVSIHDTVRPNSSVMLSDDVVDFTRTNHEHVESGGIGVGVVTPSLHVSNYDKDEAKSPSVESLTDSTTNSSFATPPFSSSPVGEGQGYYSRFAAVTVGSTSDDVFGEFPLPDIESIGLSDTREVTIARKGMKNDFGFSLRRIMTIDRTCGVCQPRSAILAELNANDENAYQVGLLPGDQLLEVNGIPVNDKTREEIVDLVRSSETSVKIKVQLLPELSELSRRFRSDGTFVELEDVNIKCGTLKRSGSQRFKHSKGKTDEQLENEKNWLDRERMWLMHKTGFTGVQLVSRCPDSGKVEVRLEATGEHATVDEDDVELANPIQFDKCENLAQLRYLNESSSLHTLRQRYGSNLIHTYASPTMIIINPMVPLNIYSEKVAQMFRGCKQEDMPAHVFALAQSVYRDTLTSRRDHSIVFIGRSGSGKTINYKQVLQYLAMTAYPNQKILTVEKLNAIWTILESFGNAKTTLNNNATRFTHLFSLDLDHSGQIASASIQIFSCEKWRIVRRSDNEHAFHILYKLVAGVDGTLRKELAMDQISASEQNCLFTPLQKSEEKQRALMDFSRICTAFKTIGISDSEIKTIYSVLAAIIHLGYAGASKSSSGRWQFNQPMAAQRAARCLGTSVEELSRSIFTQGVPMPTNVVRNTYRNSSSPTDGSKYVPVEEFNGFDALEGFVVGLYIETFNLVGSYINRSICTNAHTVNSIMVLDYPGFQNPASCGQQQDGASFNDFCHNYFHERLQLLFHYMNLDNPKERYSQEHIEVSLDKIEETSPELIVNLFDGNSSTNASNFLRTSQKDLRQSSSAGEKRVPGLLWLLDEITSLQSVNEHQFVDKVFSLYSDRENQHLIRKAPGNNHFIVRHCLGTNPVLYRADGWLKQCKENPFSKTAITFLQDSKNKDIASAFANCRGAGLTSSATMLDCSGTQSLRRMSSIRRTFTTGFKRRSLSLQVKFNIDGIIETLRRTKIKFAHCFLPHHDAGLIDKGGSNGVVSSSVLSHNSTINVPLLRSQLRGSEILPVVRLNKQGFPKSMSLAEFKRRFSLSTNNNSGSDVCSTIVDDHTAVKNILLDADVDDSSYRIGLSEIFFRSGVLSRLETLRDDKLTDRIVRFQTYCRGYLSRKKLAKLKIEDVAIRCVQRNVRKFMLVRDWPWWRLLVRITPLLNVHRTEQELKSKSEELETLRSLCEKLEHERNTLKQENAKLDAKLSEMTVDLTEEHSTANLASERLELETTERMRLENEVQYLQNQNQKLLENSEKMETELLCLKTAEVNGILNEVEDDDSVLIGEDNVNTSTSSSGGGMYKQRYERAVRELDYTKRRLQQQHHDDLEQLIALRKQLEKKIADAYEEVEEQRQVVAQWKRKVQKLNGEMSDLRLMLEDSNSRNNLLEKKQRKFDSELLIIQEELRQEKQNRDRISREKELLAADKYTLEQNINALKMDLELKEQKLTNVNRELQEITYGGSTEEEVAKLRKAKHELENKIAEQDEELDDMAGQVNLLEQAKVRLEMNLEQLRKEHKKELTQRDEENEEIRCNAVKKVKALECQLENEHEERTMLLRERHELERKIADIEDRERCNRTNDQELVNRLRRDLKKTKILLHDSQLMLQQAKLDAPNKAMLRQLRNQLEDAECARNAAIKARQMAEMDLAEMTTTLEEIQRAKSDAEEKATLNARERTQLQSQLDENEEELAEVLKKYRNTVQQLSTEQLTLHEQANRIAELESERSSLKEQLAEVTSRLENIETHGDPSSSLTVKRLELKTKELESKLELELTTRSRMEVQISRLKEAAERLQHDADAARSKETSAQETIRKLQRALREARELQTSSEAKEAIEAARKRELEKRVEQLEIELASSKADLKLALQRVDDLQCAIQGDLEDNEEEQSDSDNDDSISSNESLQSFIAHTNARGSIDRWLNNGTSVDSSKS